MMLGERLHTGMKLIATVVLAGGQRITFKEQISHDMLFAGMRQLENTIMDKLDKMDLKHPWESLEMKVERSKRRES